METEEVLFSTDELWADYKSTGARELRKRGFKAHSLAGGLQSLDAAEHA